MKNEGASLMKCGKPHEKQSVRTSCEHSEHFMTTKLSLYVCNANTSWIEIAITFSEKSKGDTSLPALFHFTCWPKPSTLPHTAAPAVNWLGAPRCLRQMKRCSEQEETTSIAKRSKRARRLCFWPKGSLVRVQHGAKIKNPVERRDFLFYSIFITR